MFTSISATSTTANADAAIPEYATGTLNATTKRSTGYAAAVAASVVLVNALLSPTTATAQLRTGLAALTDLSVGAAVKKDNSHVAVATPDRTRRNGADIAFALALAIRSVTVEPRREDVPQNETRLGLARKGFVTTAPGQKADHLSRLLRLKRRPQMRVQDILSTKGAKLSAILPDASIREAAPSSLHFKRPSSLLKNREIWGSSAGVVMGG